MTNSKILKNYIDGLDDFVFLQMTLFDHMGAIIVDGILQAGLNYDSVVKHRVQRIIDEFPTLKTTSAFYSEIEKGNLENIANWKHHEKLDRIKAVTRFFLDQELDSVADLSEWLKEDQNVAAFKTVRGIGDKTADYFQILSGNSSVAVDRHLITFVNRAGIDLSEYYQVKEVIAGAAKLLSKSEELLDYSIWLYMSSSKNKCDEY